MNTTPNPPSKEYRGMEMQAIENAQRYLRELAYFDPSYPAPLLSGIYDEITRACMKIFQQNHGLPPTGVCDETTWDTLYAAYRACLSTHTPPDLLAAFPRFPLSYAIGVGDDTHLAHLIRFLLRELEYLPCDCSPYLPYDEETAAAVKELQESAGLPPTGEVDLATWNLMATMEQAMDRSK